MEEYKREENNGILYVSFAVLFFGGGFTSLVYQVAWQRVLTQVIGIDSYSVTLIVALFMAGLGFGGLIGSRLATVRINAPLMLALLQFAMGVIGIISVPLIWGYNAAISFIPGFTPVLFLNFLLLLVPTLLMGMTTPLMVHIFRNTYSAGRATSMAYSANVMGAATGALTAGFYLAGTLGFRTTCQVMGGLDIAIGCALYILAWKGGRNGPMPSLPMILKTLGSLFRENFAVEEKANMRLLIIASFIVGFVALGYEIAYFRLFTSYFGVSPYVFPILLFAYLVNMAIGTYLSGHLLAKFREEHLYFVFTFLALISTLPILYLQELILRTGVFQQLVFVFNSSWTIFQYNMPHIIAALGLSLVLMLPVMLISGLFPLFVNTRPEDPMEAGRSFGVMYFYQTLGNTLGAFITGFGFYTFMGSIMILKVLSVSLVIGGVIFAMYRRVDWLRKRPVHAAALLSLLILIPVFGYNDNYYNSIRYYWSNTDTVPPVMTRDTVHGMSLVFPKDQTNKEFTIRSGGRFHVTSFLGSAIDSERNMYIGTGSVDLFYAFNPRIRSTLYIGLGTATEILAFDRLFPGIDIDLVEINPDVVDIIRKMGYAPLVRAIGRTNLYSMDGRRFLMHYSKKRYDLIHIGVDRATTSGAGNLFSRDFYRIVKDKLTDRGFVSFYAYPPAVKAALDIFPEVVVISPAKGIAIALGFKNTSFFNEAWPAQFAERYGDALRIVSKHEKNITFEAKFTNGQGFVLRKKQLEEVLRRVPPATDDLLVSEYYLNQNGEIRPGAWVNDRPRDFRIFEPVNGTELFPQLERLTYRMEEGREVYHWKAGEKPDDEHSVIRTCEYSGAMGRIVSQPNGLGITFQFPQWYQYNYLARNLWEPEWQWNLGPTMHKDSSNRFYTFQAVCKKSSIRGQWGLKIYWRGKDGEGYSQKITTAARGSEKLSVTQFIPAGADEMSFMLTFEDSRGMGCNTDLTIEEIRIYEHKDEYWRPPGTI